MPSLITRPLFTDVPGALPYTYVVPGSLELVVQSIVARFDGSGAGAAFLPCLSIYTQDGHLLARIRPDQEFAAGDTGVVTWAPFLRRSIAAATPSAGSLSFATMRTGTISQADVAGGPTARIISMSGATFRTNDSARMSMINDPVSGFWGILVPQGLLLEVITSLMFFDAAPVDGGHQVGSVVSGAYGAFDTYGPSRERQQKSSWSAAMGDSDNASDQGLYSIEHLAKNGPTTSTWSIGLAHTFLTYTTGPQNWRYDMQVTILGDRPT